MSRLWNHRLNRSSLFAVLVIASLPLALACAGGEEQTGETHTDSDQVEAAAGAEGQAVHWGYEESNGPELWGSL